MRLIFLRSSDQFVAQKLSGDVRGGQNLCAKIDWKHIFSWKGIFDNFVWPPKLANIPPRCVFWYKISMESAYLAIRWQSWQTWLKTKKLTNIPPPAVGGLYIYIYIYIYIYDHSHIYLIDKSIKRATFVFRLAVFLDYIIVRLTCFDVIHWEIM